MCVQSCFLCGCSGNALHHYSCEHKLLEAYMLTIRKLTLCLRALSDERELSVLTEEALVRWVPCDPIQDVHGLTPKRKRWRVSDSHAQWQSCSQNIRLKTGRGPRLIASNYRWLVPNADSETRSVDLLLRVSSSDRLVKRWRNYGVSCWLSSLLTMNLFPTGLYLACAIALKSWHEKQTILIQETRWWSSGKNCQFEQWRRFMTRA